MLQGNGLVAFKINIIYTVSNDVGGAMKWGKGRTGESSSNPSGKEYLRSLFFEQKCIPHFVTEEWRQLCDSVREELLPKKTIDLERTFINPFFCWLPHARLYRHCHQMEYVPVPKNRRFRSLLLKYSPHVLFLQKYRYAERITFSEFINDDYFLMVLGTMQLQGTFFNITGIRDIMRQPEYFLNLYRSFEKNRFNEVRKRHLRDKGGHSPEKYSKVLLVPGSDACIISDGHHRLSSLYALGKRYVTATVVGIDDFWLPVEGRPDGSFIEPGTTAQSCPVIL